MSFRVLLVSFSLFGVWTTSSFCAPQVYPTGLILRPSILERVVNAMSKKNSFELSGCVEGYYLDASLKTDFGKAYWTSMGTKEIEVIVETQGIEVTGDLFLDCEERNMPIQFFVSLDKSLDLKFAFNAVNLQLRPSPFSVKNVLDFMKVELKDLPNLSRIINRDSLKELAIDLASKEVAQYFSSWLQRRLRGLVFAQSIPEILEQNKVWQDGVEIQQGAVRLQNNSLKLQRRDLAFAFYPRTDNAFFMNDEQIEFYVNSAFFESTELGGIFNRTALSSLNSDQMTTVLTRQLEKGRTITKDAKFQRPLLPKRDADLSLLITQGLIDEALTRIYQQNLADFSLQMDFGKQVQNRVTEEKPDIRLQMDLASSKAPRLYFDPDRLRLRVEDYFLRLGTVLEDRLIPSAQIQAEVTITSNLKVDFGAQTVNLAVNPDSFEIKLAENGRFANRVGPENLQLMESLARDVWQNFFNQYQSLTLFPTLVETADARFQVVGFDFKNELILMHLNLEEDSLNL